MSEKRGLYESLGSLLTAKVCRAQVHDSSKESKGALIDFHEKYIAEKFWKNQGEKLKRSTVLGEVEFL